MLHHEKIYKVADASGELNEEHGHPTNVRPLDLSITKSVVGILFVSILMFIIFSRLAKSYAKNGGIASGADAVAKREAGADLVQVYTGLIYQGPALIKDVGEALVRYNRQNHRPSL